MSSVRLIKCRVCRLPGGECPTFGRLYLDPPRVCGLCGVQMRVVYLGGPFFGGHEGEVIAWECAGCDTAKAERRERGTNRRV